MIVHTCELITLKKQTFSGCFKVNAHMYFAHEILNNFSFILVYA